MIDRLRSQLKRHEAYRTYPYDDANGLEYSEGMTLKGKLTIGVGWNLTDNGLPDDLIEQLLDIGIETAQKDCLHLFRNWHLLPQQIQLVLLNMAFNMGRNRLGKFKKMIAAVEDESWPRMAEEMIDSAWYRQVKDRGVELVELVRGVA